MTPFFYGDFYDVPRQIVVRYQGSLYILLSAFDDEQDDYSDFYAIYAVPFTEETGVKVPPKQFVASATKIGAKLLGKIPVKDIVFDSTLRKELDASVLDPYLK